MGIFSSPLLFREHYMQPPKQATLILQNQIFYVICDNNWNQFMTEKKYMEQYGYFHKLNPKYIENEFSNLLKNLNLSTEDKIASSFNEFISKHFGFDILNDTKDSKSLKIFKVLSFDCCPNGCIVYCGINKDLINCPICQSERYYHCKKKNCISKPYDQMCLKHPQIRSSKASISYRSIELLLFELVQLESFIPAINYKNNCKLDDLPDDRHETSFERNMQEMKDEFQSFLKSYDPNQNQNLLMPTTGSTADHLIKSNNKLNKQ
jgi:hypothetical protein